MIHVEVLIFDTLTVQIDKTYVTTNHLIHNCLGIYCLLAKYAQKFKSNDS